MLMLMLIGGKIKSGQGGRQWRTGGGQWRTGGKILSVNPGSEWGVFPGAKKWVQICRDFVVTVIVITEFDCTFFKFWTTNNVTSVIIKLKDTFFKYDISWTANKRNRR